MMANNGTKENNIGVLSPKEEECFKDILPDIRHARRFKRDLCVVITVTRPGLMRWYKVNDENQGGLTKRRLDRRNGRI